jgi:hypothetical protein
MQSRASCKGRKVLTLSKPPRVKLMTYESGFIMSWDEFRVNYDDNLEHFDRIQLMQCLCSYPTQKCVCNFCHNTLSQEQLPCVKKRRVSRTDSASAVTI